MPLVIKVLVVEGIDLPKLEDQITPTFAYVKIKWNGKKYKTDIDKIHKWNKEFVFLWRPDEDTSILHIEVWTSYPGINGRHTAIGSVPIDLRSLQLNGVSRAVYGLMGSSSRQTSSNPSLKLQIQLIDPDSSATPVKSNHRVSNAVKNKISGSTSIDESTTMRLIDKMAHDTPSASKEEIRRALELGNFQLDSALEHLAAVLAAKYTETPGRSKSDSSSSSTDRYKQSPSKVGDRGRVQRNKKMEDPKVGKHRVDEEFDEKRKVLNEANSAGRKRREDNHYNPTASHQVTGTRRMVSIPIEDRLKELLPYCSSSQIKKALKKYNDNADLALDDLLDTRIEEVSQSVIAQQLSTTAVLAQGPNDLGKTFVNFHPSASSTPMGVSVAPNVATSPDEFVADNGKRKALLVGINYIGTSRELKGCIEDTKHMRKLLTAVYGFPDNDSTITVLTDDNPNTYLQPTKKNILTAFQWLVQDAEPGSVLFFHFSGHGGQKWNKHGTERDGYDETLMPLDYKKKGHIIDDEIFNVLVAPLKSGVKLTCLMDCCHSGSAMDLPFIWSSEKRRWETEFKPKFSSGDVQLLAGCADKETSADFFIPLQESGCITYASGGAMTKALRHSLATNPFGHTYPSLMDSITKFLRSWGFQQTPQLSSSQKFTFDRQFGLTTIVPNTNPSVGPTMGLRQKASSPNAPPPGRQRHSTQSNRPAGYGQQYPPQYPQNPYQYPAQAYPQYNGRPVPNYPQQFRAQAYPQHGYPQQFPPHVPYGAMQQPQYPPFSKKI